MAQFVPFQEGVEVNGHTILSVIHAYEAGKEYRTQIMAKHGLEPEPGVWYPQKAWLDAFKEIADEVGQHTLYMIGKAIPEHADFPPDIDNLEKALASLDMAYHMNHRNGEIGHYELVQFDGKKRQAVMVCNNPYPSEFDRGIITTLLRKFKPEDSFRYDVQLDRTKETRLKGGESCTYLVSW